MSIPVSDYYMTQEQQLISMSSGGQYGDLRDSMDYLQYDTSNQNFAQYNAMAAPSNQQYYQQAGSRSMNYDSGSSHNYPNTSHRY